MAQASHCLSIIGVTNIITHGNINTWHYTQGIYMCIKD